MPEYEIKPYEQLDITSNFMFAKVFSNVDIAKDFLQDVLKITIEKISVVAEATSQEDPFHKSVRFDVLAREELPEVAAIPASSKEGYASTNAVENGGDKTQAESSAQIPAAETKRAETKRPAGRYFDIEMQMRDTSELPKRARYYQSMCDLDALAKGANYDELREQYIIFISPDDIFGKGLSIYRFQNREESDHEILLNDLCYKNFYIFNKYADIKDNATREYMEYFSTQKYESTKMRRIHELVEKYRKDPIARKDYMTLEQELNIRYKKGREEGLAEGRAEGREEGLAEGFEKGEKKGEDARNKKLAKALLAEGDSIEKITRCTGLTPEEIKAL